jgi:exodeoxyribonuclease VII small subunit
MTERSLETIFDELDQVVQQLEAEDVSLEDSFNLYHKGMDLLKVCNEKIDTIEKKIIVLDENGEQHEF